MTVKNERGKITLILDLGQLDCWYCTTDYFDLSVTVEERDIFAWQIVGCQPSRTERIRTRRELNAFLMDIAWEWPDSAEEIQQFKQLVKKTPKRWFKQK